MIEAILHPATTPGKYRFEVNGETICTSRTPLLEGARRLILAGRHPATILQARHAASATPILKPGITLAALANWIVTERDRGGLRSEQWRPHPSMSADDATTLQNAISSYAELPENARRAKKRPMGAQRPRASLRGFSPDLAIPPLDRPEGVPNHERA